jgi:hypothetical protein
MTFIERDAITAQKNSRVLNLCNDEVKKRLNGLVSAK